MVNPCINLIIVNSFISWHFNYRYTQKKVFICKTFFIPLLHSKGSVHTIKHYSHFYDWNFQTLHYFSNLQKKNCCGMSISFRLEAGVKEPINQHPTAFSALTLLVRHHEVTKSIQSVNIDWWSASMVICVEQGANMFQLMSLLPHHLLPHCNSQWFCFSSAGLPMMSWKKGH